MGLFDDLYDRLFEPDVRKLEKNKDVQGLIKALKYQKNSYIRGRAANALGAMGDPRAIDPLVAALKDSEGTVRKDAVAALESLKWIPGKDEVSAYYWIGKKNFDRCVEIGTPALGPLSVALKDSDLNVRAYAAAALDTLEWSPGKDEVSAYYWISKQNFDKCVEIGTPAVEPLIASLNFHGAIRALGKIGDPRAEEPLIKMFDTNRDNKQMTKAVLYALSELGGPRALFHLIFALNDSDWGVRLAAAGELKILYKKGKLSEQEKNQILAQKSRIEELHTDRIGSTSSDCGGNYHSDSGIGLPFH
jgi:HEAT repeat protein